MRKAVGAEFVCFKYALIAELILKSIQGTAMTPERGVQRASTALAENLSRVFDGEITEIHILYPERFKGASEAA
ncbi:hypothetical protein A260_29246 [Pseudomonas syringae pv. actinidiae ICMP 19068]|nr:hypothetical protein [Pseudomonas syringae]EPM81193.1 hypothetical protein A260_29246 [Pseudomonas syringae pv. actinidiae ICMP 19068]